MNTPLQHHLTTFDSGLRLVVVPMASTKTATVLVLVGTGSKYETKEINGISHFLEHMMFKGTSKRPDKVQIARELDRIGAAYNAFTSREYTGYYAKASAQKVDIAMDVVFDIFLNSLLDEKEIEIEKGVIVEEINMYRDMPQRYVNDLFDQLLYGDQPAGWEIAGQAKTVTSFKRPQFADYFNTHYIARNTVVAVAGNVDPEYIRTKTAEYFSSIRNGERPTKPVTKEIQDKPASLIHTKKTDQSHFILGFRGPNQFDDRRYPLELLGTILGGTMSSRLFIEVREKRGLAYYISAGSGQSSDTGTFEVQAGVNNVKAHEAIQVSLDVLRSVLEKGVTAQELQDAKDHIEGSTALSLENSSNIAQTFAGSLLAYDRVLTPDEELAKMKAVTLDDVNLVAREVIKNETLNFAIIGPFEKEDQFKELLVV